MDRSIFSFLLAFILLLLAPLVTGADVERTEEETANLNAQREIAQSVIAADRNKLGRDLFAIIERLEGEANEALKKRDIDAANKACREIIRQVPGSNRAGCAMLYIAQNSGAIEDYERAFREYPNSWYGDGVNVGTYARYQLARIYFKQGNINKYEELMGHIRANHVNAVDHRGRRLIRK